MPGARKVDLIRVCRGCGCDDFHACVTDAGPCAWVLLDIRTPTGVCSACAVELEWDPEAMATVAGDFNRPETRVAS